MRVLVMTDWYPAGEGDPFGSFVRAQALAASRLHEVAVVHLATPAPGAPAMRLDAEQDGPLYTMRLRRRPGPPMTAGNLAGAALALRRLRARGFRPDLIHAHEIGAGLAAVSVARTWRQRRPVVVSVHQATFALRQVVGATALAARATFSRAEVVCAVSEDLRSRLEADGWPGRFRVVPNVVDTERFVPGPLPDGTPRIVTVAAMDPIKGLADLIEAAGILARDGADFALDVIGDGPQRPQLEARVRELAIADRVVLHGTRSAREVAAAMHAAAFAVVPSRWETFSVALSEAMACGLPVVATAVGGMPERIPEESGILVPPEDPKALADGIARMLREHRAYDRAAIAAGVRERLSPAAVGEHWDAVYREAAGRRSRALRRQGRDKMGP